MKTLAENRLNFKQLVIVNVTLHVDLETGSKDEVTELIDAINEKLMVEFPDANPTIFTGALDESDITVLNTEE
jgi:hypothetical protein